jgi:trans-2-enoyl-CoA reductase
MSAATRKHKPTITKIKKGTPVVSNNAKTIILVCTAAIGLALPASAQLGGFKKTLGMNASENASAGEKSIMDSLTPASVLLEEAATLYKEALGLKKDAAKADVKSGKLPAVKLTKDVVDNSIKDIDARMKKQQEPLTEDQKALCGKAHGKLIEGTLALAAIAVPTALEIKKVTDKNPSGMLAHPDLAILGVLCAKDSGKLISFTKTAADFNKKWGAPVSEKNIPDDAFKTN